MNRRDVLKLLGMVVPAVAFTGLPKLEVIETIAAHEGLTFSETQIIAAELEKIQDKIADLFQRDSIFFQRIEAAEEASHGTYNMRVPLEIRPGGKFGWFDPKGGSLGPGKS